MSSTTWGSGSFGKMASNLMFLRWRFFASTGLARSRGSHWQQWQGRGGFFSFLDHLESSARLAMGGACVSRPAPTHRRPHSTPERRALCGVSAYSQISSCPATSCRSFVLPERIWRPASEQPKFGRNHAETRRSRRRFVRHRANFERFWEPTPRDTSPGPVELEPTLADCGRTWVRVCRSAMQATCRASASLIAEAPRPDPSPVAWRTEERGSRRPASGMLLVSARHAYAAGARALFELNGEVVPLALWRENDPARASCAPRACRGLLRSPPFSVPH